MKSSCSVLSSFGLVVVLAGGVWLSGCVRHQETETAGNAIAAEYAGAPDWVTRGCRAFWSGQDSTEKLCGVGSMGGTNNIGLARTTAEGRARTALARTLNTRVQAMLRDYQSTATGGGQFGEAASDDQWVEDISRQVTDVSLTGTEVIDTWISSSGTFYSLIAIDLASFKDAVGKLDALNEEVRAALEARAKQAFAELDDALDKETQPQAQ